ncbi:MAG: RNA polymerase sigma factor [Candidatus Omnitrophota bacterium]
MINNTENLKVLSSRAEDVQLIKLIKQKDMDGFRILVDKYKEKTIRLAYSVTGNLADAQDIAQDVFIRVYRNIGGFRFDCTFSTWLYRIVINISRDFLRKKKKSKIVFSQSSENQDIYEQRVDDRAHNPSKMLIDKELKQRIDLAVSTLSEKQQIAFGLKYRTGLKITEIAEIMGINSSTIKVHLFRAVNSLQKKLSAYLGGDQ